MSLQFYVTYEVALQQCVDMRRGATQTLWTGWASPFVLERCFFRCSRCWLTRPLSWRKQTLSLKLWWVRTWRHTTSF